MSLEQDITLHLLTVDNSNTFEGHLFTPSGFRRADLGALKEIIALTESMVVSKRYVLGIGVVWYY